MKMASPGAAARHVRRMRACVMAISFGALMAGVALADWLQPDITYREAQMILRIAARDTAGHANDPARLDSLGAALLKLGKFDAAEQVFRRVLELKPGDDLAEAGLGKLALFENRLDEAQALLEGASPFDEGAKNDLFAARIRSGNYRAAAALAPDVHQQGRVHLLERLAEQSPYQIDGPEQVSIMWKRAFPVPLLRVKVNGRAVLMAIDTGASDLLIDDSLVRTARVSKLGGQRVEFWNGGRIAVQNALVQELRIGGMKIKQVPAGIISLRRWSIEVNPRSEQVVGVIGLNLLRQFVPTLDYKRHRLILRQRGVAWSPGENAGRVPFETWGENELTVYGSIAGSRRMAMVVQTGVPNCGIGAPKEVFDEIGIKSGAIARMFKGAGQFLHGRPWAPTTVPTVTLGPIVQDNVKGFIGALDASELWRHGVRRDALISGHFFRDRVLTIDWEKRELVIEG